jgi:hypothetical protein
MSVDEVGHSKHYTISVRVRNDKTRFTQVIGVDLFSLLGALNTDVFEKVHVVSQTDDGLKAHVVVVYKHFGKDLGLPRRYSSFNLIKGNEGDDIRVKTTAAVCPREFVPEGFSESLSDDSTSFLIRPDIDDLGGEIIYTFAVHGDAANGAMKNMAGTLMKKVLIRLKTFLEAVNR